MSRHLSNPLPRASASAASSALTTAMRTSPRASLRIPSYPIAVLNDKANASAVGRSFSILLSLFSRRTFVFAACFAISPPARRVSLLQPLADTSFDVLTENLLEIWGDSGLRGLGVSGVTGRLCGIDRGTISSGRLSVGRQRNVRERQAFVGFRSLILLTSRARYRSRNMETEIGSPGTRRRAYDPRRPATRIVRMARRNSPSLGTVVRRGILPAMVRHILTSSHDRSTTPRFQGDLHRQMLLFN